MTVIAITKLKAYGPDKLTLYLINDYLSFRNQRTPIRSSFSDWTDVTWKILRPLLFNTFIIDIFLFIKKLDICNFADDNIVLLWRQPLRNFEKSRA